MTHTLLLELLTEELPPKALARLGDTFATLIHDGLATRDFLEAGAIATAYATPRRLAVHIKLDAIALAWPSLSELQTVKQKAFFSATPHRGKHSLLDFRRRLKTVSASYRFQR